MELLCSVLDLRDEMKDHDLFGCEIDEVEMFYVSYIIVAGFILQ